MAPRHNGAGIDTSSSGDQRDHCGGDLEIDRTGARRGVVEGKTYAITTQRSGNWWAFSVPEIPGAHGQTKRLDQVKSEARDVVSMMLDVPDDSFDVELSVKLD